MTGAVLRGCPQPLAAAYDAAVLDLDGVVYLGPDPVPGAAAAIEAARAAGLRVGFVTNNSTRSPAGVAAHLAGLGIPATAGDVVTSSQAAVRLLHERVPAGAPVLVVGAAGLVEAVRDGGYQPVRRVEDDPAAVVQGLAPEAGYADLAEAVLAVRGGVPWVAANTDATLPSPRGQLPGSGALVAFVAAATGRQPLVAGKPGPALHREAAARLGARRPLVVGDRLDTDVAGAVAAGFDSLLVTTGVHGPADLLAAPPGSRPTYAAEGLAALLVPMPEAKGGRCRGWRAEVVDGAVRVARDAGVGKAGGGGRPAGGVAGEQEGDGGGEPEDPFDRVRAAAVAAWAEADAGRPVPAYPVE